MKVLPLLCFFILTSCATMESIDEHVDFNPAGHTTVYKDQYVKKSALEVYIEPAQQSDFSTKVLFLPFRVTQEINNPTMLGYSMARSVWQTWSGMRLFPSMEFSGDDTPFRRDRALFLAKQRGADLAIGGFVTYVYAGGTVGDTQIAIQVEAIDVASGQTVWSMAQSAMMQAAKKRDYFLFAVKERLPSDPLLACIREMAIDMGNKMHTWQQEQNHVADTLENMDRNINKTLFPRGKGISAPLPLPSNEDTSSGL